MLVSNAAFAADNSNVRRQDALPGQPRVLASTVPAASRSQPRNSATIGAAVQPTPVPRVGGAYGDQIASDLASRLSLATEVLRAGKVSVHSPELVARFYRGNAFQPVWVNGDGKPKRNTKALLDVLSGAYLEGLQPAYYHAKEVALNIRSLRIAFLPTARQLADFEILLTDAYLTYARHLVSGRVNPSSINADWLVEPRMRDVVDIFNKALKQNNIKQSLATLSPRLDGYQRLRDSLAKYRRIEAAGGWPTVSPGAKLRFGARGIRVKELRERLRVSDDLAAIPAADEFYFDDTLDAAVRAFQRRHGLQEDGVVGAGTQQAMNIPVSQRILTIESNMERWRWLPETLGDRHIIVNIADFEMSVVENGQQIINARAVVGRSKRPTPLMNGSMSHIIMSPYWYVPRTIAVEDKLPLLRKDPYSLRKEGIRIFSSGREIDPGTVNWHAKTKGNFSYTLRQDPGARNALGRLKFMFPNRQSIYIHDTPSRHLFDKSKRTFSSGCVRIDSPVELAEYLLRDNPAWDRDSIVTVSKKKRERRVDLNENVPVYLQYWTAWTDPGGKVHFRDDIYVVDQQMSRVLYSI